MSTPTKQPEPCTVCGYTHRDHFERYECDQLRDYRNALAKDDARDLVRAERREQTFDLLAFGLSIFILLGALTLIFSGCAGLSRATAPSERCDSLRSSYRSYGAFAVAFGTLASSGAVATVPADNPSTRAVLAISSAVLAALSTTSVFLRDDALDSYVGECGENGQPTREPETKVRGFE